MKMKYLPNERRRELPIPADQILVHNHVRPDDFHADYLPGVHGFRSWLSPAADLAEFRPCHCEWWPHLGKHFTTKANTHKETLKPAHGDQV